MALRTIKLAADEKLWIFDTDKAGAKALLKDPGKWITTNVSMCAGSRGGNYFVVDSSNPSGANRFILMGICGTSVIFMDGFTEESLKLIEEVMAVDGALPWLVSLRDRLSLRLRNNVVKARTLAFATWDDVDAALLKVVPKTEIELFFFEEEQKGFIHFELGKDPDLIDDFKDLIRTDPSGYLKWLQGQVATPTIPRSAFKVPMGGVPVAVKFTAFELQQGTNANGTTRDIHLLTEKPGPINCIDPCIPTACDSNFATIVSGTLAGNDLVVEVEIGMDKAYCKNKVTGDPCP